MRGITKRYPGVLANDHIDLDVRPGEIHALLGENGAGKTTLMNILYGLAAPDAGEILLDGKPVTIGGPSDAIRRGISMVHQHFMLVPVLSVADNILLGEEPMAGPVFLDRARRASAHPRARPIGSAGEIDPDAKVGDAVGGLAAARRDPEGAVPQCADPGARRADRGADAAGDQGDLRRAAAARRARARIIFISHKLYEVLEIADRITVIRRGKVVGQRLPAETNEEDLAELMVGREVQLTVDRGTSHPGDAMLVVEGLRVRDDRGREVVHGVELEVRAGEIFGSRVSPATARTSWSRRSIGLRRPTRRHGRARWPATSPATARASCTSAGVAFVPGRPPPLRPGAVASR